MQPKSPNPLDLDLVQQANAELDDLDLECVAGGMDKFGPLGRLPSFIPFRSFPMMSFPSIKIPNFFGS